MVDVGLGCGYFSISAPGRRTPGVWASVTSRSPPYTPHFLALRLDLFSGLYLLFASPFQYCIMSALRFSTGRCSAFAFALAALNICQLTFVHAMCSILCVVSYAVRVFETNAALLSTRWGKTVLQATSKLSQTRGLTWCGRALGLDIL